MHHCNNIAKEKQLLKVIRQTEEDKQKFTVNVAVEKLKLPKHLSSVDQIQDSIEVSTSFQLYLFQSYISLFITLVS